MTAGPSIDPARFLNEQLAQASPDLMRELLTTFVNALLSAQADAVCGAGYGERSSERVNSRNSYRHRDLDTRVGALDVAVPKLRQGSLYPDWLLERRKRAERALTSVVATCYLLGVSTRRMDKLVQTSPHPSPRGLQAGNDTVGDARFRWPGPVFTVLGTQTRHLRHAR
jgi:putative transposase